MLWRVYVVDGGRVQVHGVKAIGGAVEDLEKLNILFWSFNISGGQNHSQFFKHEKASARASNDRFFPCWSLSL